MIRRRLLFSLLVLVSAVFSRNALAQSVDVIRGRVVGPDSLPLQGVRVTVTSVSGAVNRNATTDRNGRYTVTFPGGDGDYFVSFASLGYAPRRFEVKRVADEDFLVADARLQRSANVLEGVTVTAPRDRVNRNDANADVSGTDKAINTSNLSADQLGNLAAMAASLPGVLLIPGADGDPSGFSVLGLSSDQNSTTLNGQNFGGSDLPRDASVGASLVTSPYDVSRGGFSGGQLNVRTLPGNNFIQRTNSLNLDAPPMQWTDAAARALGQEYLNASLGGRLSGPVKFDHSFYNFSYQAGRRQNDLQTLLNTDLLGLQSAGIAKDSVDRLMAVLGALNVPATSGTTLDNRASDQAMILGSYDITPPSSRNGAAYNITTNLSWNRTAPVGAGITELPSHSGERSGVNATIQGRHSSWFTLGSIGILSETSMGLSGSNNESTPYLTLPSGTVRIASHFPDGTDGVKTVSFGGSPVLNTRGSNTSMGFTNQLSWFSANNKHRLKLSTELRRDGYSIDQTTNQLGSFSFNSLSDLAGGLPASFTRALSQRVRNGSQVVGSVALGDSYKKSNTLQIQYGLRVDGNYLPQTPNVNPEIQQLFGARNDAVPNGIYVSPRVGFSWTYGTSAQVGGFEGAFRGPRSVVRGGVGIFQGLPGTQVLGGAIDNTGLPSAIQQVNCVGVAAPTPDWAAYLANSAAIPDLCANGTTGSVFSNTAPNVTLFAKDYVAARSLRSNLNWSGTTLHNRLNTQFEVTYSANLNQPGAVDLNFSPVQRFTLADEGARPVFVLPGSIDPTTGFIASSDARVSSKYNRVTENRSDLRSESKQFRTSISPVTFSSAFSWSLSYVYSNVRERVRGFGGSGNTVGNPLTVEWSRSPFDSRHQLQYSLFYNLWDAIRINWSGSFRAGMPFTPLVSGDVNGDGYSNDRAYIYDPASTADPALASAMQTLLNSTTGNARSCLARQLGTLAARNSCQGPWTSFANLSISFNPIKVRMPQRATLSLSVSNPLGAADLLLHDDAHLRGWGQSVSPDQSLLYVRGFDAASQRFKYEVNQRFGSSNPAFSVVRQPVTVTAMMRFDIGPTRERQSLTQQLNMGRRRAGNKLPEQMLKAIYGTGSLLNPMATILRQGDTLKLTAPQADSVATLNRWYLVRLDSIWSPVAKFMAELPNDFDEDLAYHRYKKAREASVDLLARIGPNIKGLLTAEQKRRLPVIVTSYLDPRYLAAVRSGTAGGSGTAFGPGGGIALPAGGGGPGAVTIIR